MRARGLIAATLALLAAACASNAGSGATLGLDEPTTSTVDRTTTTAPTGTTNRPTTTVPVTDDSPTDGDRAVCAHADEIMAGFEPTASPDTLQAAVEGMVVDSWRADDRELVAATDSVLDGLAAYDVEAAWQAITEYVARCAALGALE